MSRLSDFSSTPLKRFRAWLRSDLRVLRWVFLSLYLLLIAGLFAMSLMSSDTAIPMMITIAVVLGSQALFIFGAGTIQLCRPIRRRRLVLPVFVAATMLTILITGTVLAITELLKVDLPDSAGIFFWTAMSLCWVVWGVLLFNYAVDQPRYQVLSRFSRMLFAGSLAELLATVPSHLVVIRRPGCLVGLLTMIGIVAGLAVMIFSFGPMIVLLFLRPLYRAEKASGNQFCETCGYDLRASMDRCPECGTPFQSPSQKRALDPKLG